jgi:alkylhydroperoxidase family enzyme
MLCEAAELEHGIMCQYLFAAFSLKRREDAGLRPEGLEAVTRWRHVIAHVATEEMLHLALGQRVRDASSFSSFVTDAHPRTSRARWDRLRAR